MIVNFFFSWRMQQDKVKASENMAIVAGEVQVYQNNKDANYEALAIE